jgi:hypothetical protein
MIERARTPIAKVRNSILRFGVICSVFYIIYFLLMRAFGLTHITALRAVNYLVLFAVCFYGIKKWVSKTKAYVPFLTVFGITFFSGLFSFLLFSIFLFFYMRFDTSFNEVVSEYVPSIFRDYPSVLVFFEGSAISIIVGFINMQYFRRYEEGEVELKKESEVNKSV